MVRKAGTWKQNEHFKDSAFYDCLKIIKRFYPDLFRSFKHCNIDPRMKNRITYTTGIILTMLFFKCICSIVSMHGMTRQFNYEMAVKNLLNLSSQTDLQNIPHYQTINDFLCRLSPVFLEELRCKIIYNLVRTNQFYSCRLNKKYWIILIDGTGIYGGTRKINCRCLFRTHHKGEKDQYTTYHIQLLEAKLLLFGYCIPISIMTEYIENTPEMENGEKPVSDEKYKQDCERKAFERLAVRLKERFPRLPICIVADALYNTEPIIATCEKYHWKFIFRFKDGTIKSIAEEVQSLAKDMENGKLYGTEPVQDVAYLKDLDYSGHKISFLKAKDRKIEKLRTETRGRKKSKKETDLTSFQWITNLELTPRFAVIVALVGRERWRIENEGFNRQKNWVGNITHLCSWNEQAIKNHYAMMQIAEIFRQLYEYVNLTKEQVERTFQQIADDLYTALRSIDIFSTEDANRKKILEKIACV